MKILIPNYTFNAAAKQITFPGYSTLSLASFLIITDTTVNQIIYNFADSTAGGTVAGNVLTLTYNTTALSNTDALLIYYDDATIQARDASLQLMEGQNDLLRRMVKLMESQGTVDSSNRQRVSIDASTATVATSLASTTVTSITMPASTPIGSALTAQAGNSYPDSVNPYTLTSRAALLISEYPIGQEWRMADQAKATFGVSIRANIK